MRKSSKLLAVLLTLCLLFGAITAIFVSAEEGEATTPTLAQQATTAQLKVGDKLGYVSVSNSTVSSTANRNLSEPYLIDILPTETSDGETSDGYEYVTIDMDFYLDLSEMTTTTHEFFQIMVLSANDDTGNGKVFPSAAAFLAYNSTEKAYFLSFDSSGAEARPEAKVSDVVDVYDHLTYVLKFEATTTEDGTSATAVTTSIYLNGTFIDKSEPNTTTTSKLQISRAATKSSAWGGRKIGVDNLAINYFEADSVNTLALETALTGNAPLYNATSGVLYTAAYPTPDKTVVELKGEQLTLPAALKEFANMSTGDTITVWGGRKLAYAPIPAGVKSFNVACNDGSTFNVPGFEANEDGTVYTVVRENDYTVTDTAKNFGATTVPNTDTSGNRNFSLHGKTATAYELSQFKYVTLDFDFAFTGDTFKEEYKTQNANGVLFKMNYANGSAHTAVNSFGIDKVDGVYYFEGVRLANVADVYDHFTVVYEISGTQAKLNVTAVAFYLNGELVSVEESGTTIELGYNILSRLNIQQVLTTENVTAEAANISLNYYTEAESTGLESVLADGSGIYNAGNVVCNEDYLIGNENKYATVGDDSYKYYVIGGAFNNVSEGGTVYLNNVVGEYTLPKNFLNLTVVDKTGTFSPSAADEAMYNIGESNDGNEYTYTYELKNYAVIDEVPYADIDEAFLALEEGGTITVVGTVADYTLPKILESFTVEGDFTLDYFNSDAYCATVVDEETTTYTNVFAREQLMASVSLFSSAVNFKLYLPKLEGLTFTPGTIAQSVNLVYDELYGGYTAVWTPPVWHYADEREVTITGTYVNGETEGTVTIASKLSITGYALKVIENTTQYPCGGEAQQVVRAMIEYKLAVATYKPAQASGSFTQSKKEGHINSLTTFLAKYNTLHSDCQCGKVVAEGTHIKVGTVADTEPTNLLSNVYGVTFGFAGANQGYYLIITGVESETAPTISYVGHKGNSRTPITASLEAMTTEGNYSYEFAASDLDNEFTVTINDVEYVYSLAYYLDAANTALAAAEAKVAEGDEAAATDVTTWTEAIAQANALAKYALAAENYKVYVK